MVIVARGKHFTQDWSEVAGLVPEDAQRILDVGCRAGVLGAKLKESHPRREIVGIEPDAAAAALAREHLDQVFVGELEHTDLFFQDGYFDCILYTDALHHVAEPRKVLRRHLRLLAPDGCLLARLPNRNYVKRLKNQLHLRPDAESGLIEASHDALPDRDGLWTFSRDEIQQLFFQSGFEIEFIGPENEEALKQLQERPACKSIAFERTNLDLRGLGEEQVADFFTPYFIVQAKRRNEPAARRTTSVIVPVCNQVDLTRQCLDSLLDNTPDLHEIIFIDNGSDDDTSKFFDFLLENWESVVDNHENMDRQSTLSRSDAPGDTTLRVISNSRNIGVPGAINQGIESATGQYLVVLHNDVLLTPGWLDGLLRCAENAPGAVIVGPTSNRIASTQADPKAFYEGPDGLEDYAEQVKSEREGEWLNVPAISTTCMLIRRQLIDLIGTFDERFGYGLFEDNDFCLRARKAGGSAYVASDVYVHHFGGQTFQALSIDTQTLFQENEKKFQAKLQEPPSEQPRPSPAPELVAPDPHRGLSLVRDESDEPESYETLVQALIERGREAAQTGDLGAAFKALTKAVEHAPDNSDANNDLAWVSFRQGMIDHAENCWKRALEIEPGNIPAKRNLADFYFNTDRFTDAVALYEDLLINRAADFDVIDALGDAYLELHNYEGAVNAYQLLEQSLSGTTSPLANQTRQKLALAQKRQQECITV